LIEAKFSLICLLEPHYWTAARILGKSTRTIWIGSMSWHGGNWTESLRLKVAVISETCGAPTVWQNYVNLEFTVSSVSLVQVGIDWITSDSMIQPWITKPWKRELLKLVVNQFWIVTEANSVVQDFVSKQLVNLFNAFESKWWFHRSIVECLLWSTCRYLWGCN